MGQALESFKFVISLITDLKSVGLNEKRSLPETTSLIFSMLGWSSYL